MNTTKIIYNTFNAARPHMNSSAESKFVKFSKTASIGAARTAALVASLYTLSQAWMACCGAHELANTPVHENFEKHYLAQVVFQVTPRFITSRFETDTQKKMYAIGVYGLFAAATGSMGVKLGKFAFSSTALMVAAKMTSLVACQYLLRISYKACQEIYELANTPANDTFEKHHHFNFIDEATPQIQVITSRLETNTQKKMYAIGVYGLFAAATGLMGVKLGRFVLSSKARF